MIKRIVITILSAWMILNAAVAQTVTPGLEMGELVRIGYSYRQSPYLSFDIKYQYADSTAPTVILEEVTGQYKMHEGRYWAMLDSTELVQGNNYSLAVFHDEKVISIHKPQYTDNRIFQVPVLDSVFGNYIDSMRVSVICDSMNLLKIYFKTGVPYSGYELRYNPNTYLVNSMQFYMKDGEPGDSTSSTKLIKISMCNYCDCVISEDYFTESKFIYKDTSFYTKPAYSDYSLLVDGDF